MVVVTIIVLLMAMLSPCFKRTQQLTRRAMCLSNQRQTATGFAQYAANHRSFLPQIGWNDPPLGVQKHSCPYFYDMPVADMLVENYLGNYALLYCPSYLANNMYNEFGWCRSDPEWGDNHDAGWWYYAWPKLVNYPIHWRVVSYNCTSFPRMSPEVRTSTMHDKSDKVLLFDMACSKDTNLANPWGNDYWVRVHWDMKNARPEGENVTRIDGSSIWKEFKELEPNYTNGGHWWWW